jgi:excisionase family DNA binding protein
MQMPAVRLLGLRRPPATSRSDRCLPIGEEPEGLKIEISDIFLERLANLIAARINAGDSSSASPWMTAAQAARYLGCSVSRVRTLTLTGELPSHRDGRRPLYHREELDAYVRAGGASCP